MIDDDTLLGSVVEMWRLKSPVLFCLCFRMELDNWMASFGNGRMWVGGLV